MVGRLRKHRLEIGGSRTTWGLRRRLSEQTEGTDLRLDFTWKMRSNTDHWPFYQHEKPVLLLHTGLHENYHRPSDDSHTLNADGMREVTRFLFGSVMALANAERLPGFRQAAFAETPAVKHQLESPTGPPPRRLGVGWDDEVLSDHGVLLTHVYAGLPAQQGGLRSGDRIISFAGRPIRRGDDLRAAVLASGAKVEVVVRRAGMKEPRKLSITLPGEPVTLGISWREDEAEPGSVLLTRVYTGSPAQRAGLKARDRIYQVGGADFASGDEFLRRVKQSLGSLELLVETEGRLRTVQLELLPSTTKLGMAK